MVFKAKVTQVEIRKLALAYRKKLERLGYPVASIVLFGSYTQDRAHDWSDIDLVVVLSKFTQHHSFDEDVKVSVIAKKLSPLLEVHPVSPEEFDNPDAPWLLEAKRYGKQLI